MFASTQSPTQRESRSLPAPDGLETARLDPARSSGTPGLNFTDGLPRILLASPWLRSFLPRRLRARKEERRSRRLLLVHCGSATGASGTICQVGERAAGV